MSNVKIYPKYEVSGAVLQGPNTVHLLLKYFICLKSLMKQISNIVVLNRKEKVYCYQITALNSTYQADTEASIQNWALKGEITVNQGEQTYFYLAMICIINYTDLSVKFTIIL